MNTVIAVAIVFGSIVMMVALVCGTVLTLVKARREGLSPSGRKARTDEAAVIQELYQGLARMEKRVEALETILMESQGKDGYTR
ncbi:phage-shock protein [Desulfoprunum benzoelyticum]|uniref:Phage shock protein B n=1 Tax=Desulfoprunum benzoelyticum TaxID=1506996 RepID=A0A840V5H0_9BACT|nr:phage-shock protein [Desulfoprunum benzoelyticum]MBB5349160.1 phage shock protein B [Desulfoprunum benzoelyticum]MBM9530603.1 phage-shock protein [Desulfoprunum benzoelyticum]